MPLQLLRGVLRWISRGGWRVLALLALVGAAFLNQWLNIDNPALERKLVGCWTISGGNETMSSSAVLHVLADGTFTELSVNKLGKMHGFASASGSWQVQRDKWMLNYTQTSGDLLLSPRGRHVMTIVEADEHRIVGKGGWSGYYVYDRIPAPNGSCRPTV